MTAKYWPDSLGVFLQRKKKLGKKMSTKRGGVLPLWTKVLNFFRLLDQFPESDPMAIVAKNQYNLHNQPQIIVSMEIIRYNSVSLFKKSEVTCLEVSQSIANYRPL